MRRRGTSLFDIRIVALVAILAGGVFVAMARGRRGAGSGLGAFFPEAVGAGAAAAPGLPSDAGPGAAGAAAGGASPASPPGPGTICSAPADAPALLAQAEETISAGRTLDGLVLLRRAAVECSGDPAVERARARAGELARQHAARADEAARANDAAAAWQARSLAWLATLDASEREPIRAQLDRFVAERVLTARVSPGDAVHTVVPGETLERIARQEGVPWERIALVNRIDDPSRLRIGQRLRILRGDVLVVVLRDEFTLAVFVDGRYIKQYRIGTGRDDGTPIGDFVIETRVAEPTWYAPGGRVYPYGHPENILGTHWLGFARTESASGFGIHGTALPETIGTASSAGCVRMCNEDVREVFALVPIGGRVSITR